MKRSLVLLTLVLGACASNPQPPLQRVEAPPPRYVQPTEERSGASSATPVDEDATRAFLDREIERRGQEGPLVEPRERRTVYVPEFYDSPWPWQRDLRREEFDYDVQYVSRPYSYYGYGYRPRFPLGSTLFGAGLGAIIGHQSGRRDRGAAIGAGLGYLLGRHRY